MATVKIFQTPGHFAPAPVKVQKFPADLSQTREVKFSPVAGDGNASPVISQIVSRDTFVAWLAETDGEARTKILAESAAANPDWTPRDHKTGTVSPTRGQIALMRELLTMQEAATLAASGIAVLVSTRGDDSAAGKAGKTRKTEAEKAAEAFALMFPEPVAEVTGQEIANAAAEIVATVNPAEVLPGEIPATVPAAGKRGRK